MECESPCQYLDWDSDFFGYRIGRVKENRLRRETIEAILSWSHVQEIDCLYFLAELHDRDTITLAEGNGFRFVDIRVTLEYRLDGSVEPGNGGARALIRSWCAKDIPALKTLSRQSYGNTRFYFDPHFTTQRADALYETWIEKSCYGYADAVLVAEMCGEPAGYISCHLNDTSGQLGLVAVSENRRGMAVGKDLVRAALRWFSERGARQVRVVTQARNREALRLYEKCGFLTSGVELWYHRWFNKL